MSADQAFEGVRPIRRWDREPSEFYEAVMRILAELRYNPRSQECRYPEPDGPVRRTVIGIGFSGETREQLILTVSQLTWLLPTLERQLHHSRKYGLERIDHYRGMFSDACALIDLDQFQIDENASLETLAEQTDALSRALLLKSELILIVQQFNLLREPIRTRPAPASETRLKAVA